MRIIKFLFFSLIFIPLAACNNASLVDQFFNNQSAGSGAVEVLALQHLGDGSSGEISSEQTKIFSNDLGYEIELTAATLHFHRISLFSDGDDPQCIGGNDQDISIHHTQDLLGEDLLTHHMGTEVVPTVNYCEFEVQVGHDGGEVFHLKGHWSKGGDSGDFELMGMEEIMISHIFKAEENGEVIVHPLHFAQGETVISVLLGIKYDLLLDGVDFRSQSADAQIDAIYRNLPTVIHQHGDSHDDGGHAHP